MYRQIFVTMKKQYILLTIMSCALFGIFATRVDSKAALCVQAPFLQNTNDSIAMVLKIKTLSEKEEALKNRIKEEDGKRNAVYNGVSPETQERMNDRQDSLCLDLRSQLVDVQLEIKEVKRANLLQVILSGKTSK